MVNTVLSKLARSAGDEPYSANELADSIGINAKILRGFMRKHQEELGLAHERYKRWKLWKNDVCEVMHKLEREKK